MLAGIAAALALVGAGSAFAVTITRSIVLDRSIAGVNLGETRASIERRIGTGSIVSVRTDTSTRPPSRVDRIAYDAAGLYITYVSTGSTARKHAAGRSRRVAAVGREGDSGRPLLRSGLPARLCRGRRRHLVPGRPRPEEGRPDRRRLLQVTGLSPTQVGNRLLSRRELRSQPHPADHRAVLPALHRAVGDQPEELDEPERHRPRRADGSGPRPGRERRGGLLQATQRLCLAP